MTAFCSAGCCTKLADFVHGRQALFQVSYILSPMICVFMSVWPVCTYTCHVCACCPRRSGGPSDFPEVRVTDGYETAQFLQIIF